MKANAGNIGFLNQGLAGVAKPIGGIRPWYDGLNRSWGELLSAIDYQELEGPIEEAMLLRLGTVAGPVFTAPGQPGPTASAAADQLRSAVNGHRWIHLCTATVDGHLVGFKVGRSNDPRTFESWVGGVLPKARQQGIASHLARLQEAWCRANGFQFIQTETAHDNAAMLTVNLKQGFCIAGTYLDRGTHLKVILQKDLNKRNGQ